MIFMDKKNFWWDVQRLAWRLWSFILFFALGYLLCNYLYDKTNNVHPTMDIPIKVTCEPIVRTYLVKLPQTWIVQPHTP